MKKFVRAIISSSILTASILLISSHAVAAPPVDADDVVRHLEFGGYNMSTTKDYISAQHPEKPNITLKQFQGGVLFTSYLPLNDNFKSNRLGLLNLLNDLNNDAVAVRYYVYNDEFLVTEGYYPGRYDKALFSLFLDRYNLSQKQISGKYEYIKRYLK
jgi:hypothetical protein